MTRGATLAMVLALVPAASGAVEAKRMCFQGPLPPQVISGARAKIAGSGGVIVASGDELPDWRFRDLNRVVRPRVVTLAPGLAIYHPPPLAGTDVVVEDTGHGEVARTERALTIEPPPGAPDVARITSTEQTAGRRIVDAQLTTPTPEHAIIVVVSKVVSTLDGTRVVPLTWANVPGSNPSSVRLWYPPGGCDSVIERSVEPRAGDRVVLTWVDDAGRVSEPSKPLVIAGGSKGK